MKVFISHSSRDKVLIDYFVEKILILGCGINEKEIFCSSIEGLGIKTGLDFREHIKSTLQKSDYSFLFISENYKKSDICLNEMGASWVQENIEVKPFIFPNIGFDSIGTLYSVKQVARLDKKSDLDELFDELRNKYGINRKISRWNKNKEDFLKFLESYFSSKPKDSESVPTDYFNQFVQKNVSLYHLLLECHPTLLDCKVIFRKEFYKYYFKKYCEVFMQLDDDPIESLYPKRKFFRVTRTNTMELLKDTDNTSGGMVSLAEKNVFNYDVDFYTVQFLEKEQFKSGITYRVFCYVNNRWVFIPKPWRIKIPID